MYIQDVFAFETKGIVSKIRNYNIFIQKKIPILSDILDNTFSPCFYCNNTRIILPYTIQIPVVVHDYLQKVQIW